MHIWLIVSFNVSSFASLQIFFLHSVFQDRMGSEIEDNWKRAPRFPKVRTVAHILPLSANRTSTSNVKTSVNISTHHRMLLEGRVAQKSASQRKTSDNAVLSSVL